MCTTDSWPNSVSIQCGPRDVGVSVQCGPRDVGIQLTAGRTGCDWLLAEQGKCPKVEPGM